MRAVSAAETIADRVEVMLVVIVFFPFFVGQFAQFWFWRVRFAHKTARNGLANKAVGVL